jgi:hypothetical protein
MPADFTKVLSKTFTAELITQGSWGHRDLGSHESTMDLYLRTDASGFIEWDVPALETTENIGLTFSIDPKGVRTLLEYDGVMSMPAQAVDVLREAGIVVSNEFDDRCVFTLGECKHGYYDAWGELSGYEAGRTWLDHAKVGDQWRSEDGTIELKREA